MQQHVRRFFPECRGAALIEFAFVLPVLTLLLFGAIELSRYILITQKVEKAGYVLGDTLSQYSQAELTIAHLQQVFSQYKTVMSPYDDDSRQRVIFTSVTKDPADHQIKINWQVVGGGQYSDDKVLSIVDNKSADSITPTSPAPGTHATWSGNSDITSQLSSMWDGENMIVAEVFYHYTPFITATLNTTLDTDGFTFNAATLVRRTYFHPRDGDLTSPPS